MDFLQEFIQEQIPQAAYLYHAYYEPYSAYLRPIFRILYLSQSYFYRYIYPSLYPLYTLVNKALHSIPSDSPDLFTLFITGAVLLISFKALDYLRRTIIYWISMAIRLGMWVTIIAVGLYVSQRGLERSVEDVGWAWGLLAGLEEEGSRVGGRKAAGRENAARRMREGGPRGRTRGAGW